ncbi:MAG: hypothetical protein LBR94_08855 [Desulfovibrio sp.]|jgi:hypothetical protein|nr:hypothetical protein [Desulfovibrio sp.]
MGNWHERYLGIPWAAVPEWPESATCGELVRHVFLDLHGIESAPIPVPDAGILRDCIAAMSPDGYPLEKLPDGEHPRDFDICFLGKARYLDHVGIGARTADGLLILHCMQGAGVVMDSPAELAAMGFTRQRWYRCTRLES